MLKYAILYMDPMGMVVTVEVYDYHDPPMTHSNFRQACFDEGWKKDMNWVDAQEMNIGH